MKQAIRVLDQNGKPIAVPRRNMSSSMVGAKGVGSYYGGSDVRELASWHPGTGSADADYLPQQNAIVGRSRDLTRNDPVAAGYVRTQQDTIIGDRYKLRYRPRMKLLRRVLPAQYDDEWFKDLKAQVETQWADYADNPDQTDVQTKRSFIGVLRQAVFDGVANGDACVVPYWLPSYGQPSNTMMLLIESDRLCTPPEERGNDRVRGGVETTRLGRPIAYHVRNQHPGDWWWPNGMMDYTWRRIPARFANGRKRFLHVHDVGRTGETRGVSGFAPVIGDLHLGQRYRRAELARALAQSFVQTYSQSNLDTNQILHMLGAPDEEAGETALDLYERWRSSHVVPMSPLTHIQLPIGDTFEGFAPTSPNANAADFLKGINRHNAAGLHMSIESLMNDFSDTNYSAARAAWLKVWKFWMARRQWIDNNLAGPWFGLWLEEQISRAVNDPLRIDIPNFYEHISAWCNALWIGPGAGFVDPDKEIKAAEKRINLKLTTREYECAQLLGLDWEDEVVPQLAHEMEVMAAAGLGAGAMLAEAASTIEPDEGSILAEAA